MEQSLDADRVIVGVDGSKSSVAALRYAARIAEAFDAPIEAVTAWSYPPFAEPALMTEWSPESDAAAILDDAIAEAFGDAPPRELTRSVLVGPAARALIERSEGCAMLVLGSRGLGGFAGLLLGSVSAACAAHAKCTVVIVHPPASVTGHGASEPPAEPTADET
ncbi:universal stress protein [Microbacterium sp. E-13]|uniref:universal stress protein n=1 Tax=Microbacterium sp. E-13 TaxID=3404048 RepID=UPI003CF18C70